MINTKVRFTKGRIIDRNNNKEINFVFSVTGKHFKIITLSEAQIPRDSIR